MNVIDRILKLFNLQRISNAPNWYTPQELWEVIRKEESAATANRIALHYAMNLQQAFGKGYEIGCQIGETRRKWAAINERLS